jgi:hypothetical protein
MKHARLLTVNSIVSAATRMRTAALLIMCLVSRNVTAQTNVQNEARLYKCPHCGEAVRLDEDGVLQKATATKSEKVDSARNSEEARFEAKKKQVEDYAWTEFKKDWVREGETWTIKKRIRNPSDQYGWWEIKFQVRNVTMRTSRNSLMSEADRLNGKTEEFDCRIDAKVYRYEEPPHAIQKSWTEWREGGYTPIWSCSAVFKGEAVTYTITNPHRD